MIINYNPHTGGNTKYAGMKNSDKQIIIRGLQRDFYRFLEEAIYDNEKSQTLFEPMKEFKRGRDKKTNCMQTFLAGVLGQHALDDRRDFSVGQLEGITLASKVFDYYYGSGVIEFSEDYIADEDNSVFSKLFKRGE